MGGISTEISGDVSVGTKSIDFEFADADINRLVDWGEYLYTLNGGEGTPTIQQKLEAWFDYCIMNVTKRGIEGFEYKAARDAVPPADPWDHL